MNCSICGQELNKVTLGLKNILNEEESKRLEKIRKKEAVCSECKIQILLLNL